MRSVNEMLTFVLLSVVDPVAGRVVEAVVFVVAELDVLAVWRNRRRRR